MSDELVRQYVDEAAVTQNTDFFIHEVARAKAAYQELVSAKTKIKETKAFPEMVASNNEAAAATDKLTNSHKKLANQVKVTTLEQEKLKQANLQANAELRNQAKEANAADGSLNKMRATLVRLNAERSKGVVGSDSYKQLTTQIQGLNAQITAEEQAVGQFQRNVGNYDGSLKVLAKGFKGLGALGVIFSEALGIDPAAAEGVREFGRALRDVTHVKEFDKLATEGQTEATEAQKAATIAQATTMGGAAGTTELYTVSTEAATVSEVEFTAATVTATAAQKALKIALVGLGIAAVVVGIGLLIYEYIKYQKAIEDVVRQRELQNKVEKEAAETAGKEIGTLEALYTAATKATIPIKERKKAVDELQKQYPEYFKNIKDEIILQGKAGDAYDKTKAAILESAKARAIENQLGELATKELKIRFEQEDRLTDLKAAKENQRLSELKSKQKTYGQINGQSPEDLLRGTVAVQSLNDQLKNSNKELEDIEKDRKFLLDQITAAPKKLTDDTKTPGDKQLSQLKDKFDAQYDLYRIDQERKLRLYEDAIKSDKTYYLDKLDLLEKYNKDALELNLVNFLQAETVARKKAAAEVQKLEEEKAGKNAAQKERINENIKRVNANLQQELLVIESDYADKGLQITEKVAGEKVKVVEDHLKEEQALYEEYSKQQQEVYDKTLSAFKKALEERDKAEKEAAKKLIEYTKEVNAKKVEYAIDAEKSLFSIAESGYDRSISINKQKEDDIDKQTAQELAANDTKIQSEQDKAANITIINARAQIQKEQLERKNAELENKKARFERLQQIFEISINTIKAIAAIKAQAAIFAANPIGGQALAAVALSQIPFVLGSAALSLAALAAQPIPKYALGKGRGDNYSGPAILNEIRDEVIEHGDGSVTFPEGRNVVTNVSSDDIVHPDRHAWMTAILNAAHRDAMAMMGIKSVEGNPIMDVMKKQTALLNKIANKRELRLGASEGGMVALWMHGANTISYLDENTQWNKG